MLFVNSSHTSGEGFRSAMIFYSICVTVLYFQVQCCYNGDFWEIEKEEIHEWSSVDDNDEG